LPERWKLTAFGGSDMPASLSATSAMLSGTKWGPKKTGHKGNQKKEVYRNVITSFNCSFSLFAQRKRTKRKGSLALGPPSANCPALLAKSERFGKSQSLYPLAGYSAESF